jgi:proline iminopeptidase
MLINRRTFSRFILAAGLPVTYTAATRATASTDSSGMVSVPGGRVWWRRVGSGSKTPLLLLHGGPGGGHDYFLPLADLADDRPVIFYDQLGCGRSDSPADPSLYTIQRAVDELEAVRHGLGLREVVLFGHSWGTTLAIEALSQGRGGGVKALILSGAIPSYPQFVSGTKRLLAAMPNGTGARMSELEQTGKANTPEYQTLVQDFYDAHVCRRKPWPPEVMRTVENLDHSIAYRLMNGPNEFTVTGLLRDWDRRTDLPRIALPLLLTTGEFDEVTLDCHLTVKNAVKGAALKIFPACSHLTMNEKPVEYVATLRSFLASV